MIVNLEGKLRIYWICKKGCSMAIEVEVIHSQRMQRIKKKCKYTTKNLIKILGGY